MAQLVHITKNGTVPKQHTRLPIVDQQSQDYAAEISYSAPYIVSQPLPMRACTQPKTLLVYMAKDNKTRSGFSNYNPSMH